MLNVHYFNVNDQCSGLSVSFYKQKELLVHHSLFFYLYDDMIMTMIEEKIRSHKNLPLFIYIIISLPRFRMGCLLFTWLHKATTSTVSNTFCSTRLPSTMSRWTTWRRYMWQRTAVTTESPNCCWTRGPTPTPGHWYDSEILWNFFNLLPEIQSVLRCSRLRWMLNIVWVRPSPCAPCLTNRMASLRCT